MNDARRVSDLLLIERFKQFYSDLSRTPLDDIGSVYSNDVVFRDPVHEIRGLPELHAYMKQMNSGLTSGRFEYLDQLIASDSAYIKWDMYFRHPKLGRNEICVRGMSHICFTDRISYHEDAYDMGAMLYEQIPLLGRGVRFLKQRLAQTEAGA